MSYSHFESGNADYWLVMARHDKMTEEDVFSSKNMPSLDAIVLEDCGLGNAIFRNNQYGDICKKAYAFGKKIYTMDIPSKNDVECYIRFENILTSIGQWTLLGSAIATTALAVKEKLTRRRLIGMLGLSLAAAVTGVAGILPNKMEASLTEKGEASDFAEDVISYETELMKTEIITMRNAVNARKAEEGLAPMLALQLGRKPKIAMVYGAYHAGIEHCILDKRLRDELLLYFSDVLKSDKESPVFEKMLNSIYEYTSSEHGYDKKEYRVGLF